MNELLRNTIINRLVELGWTRLGPVALANRYYQSEVGPKEAQAYLADYGPAETTVLLTGTFYSEGNNCLSTSSVSIPRTADETVVNELVDKFVANAEAAIAQSYAVRLYRMFPKAA